MNRTRAWHFGWLAAVLLAAASGVLAASITYTYDARGRVTRAEYADGRSIAYTSDAAGNILTRTTATGSGSAPVNYQGLWWNSPANSESGWGINFAHQGSTIFATWFTFGLDGKPLWLVTAASLAAPGVYSGALYTGTGPAFNAVPFNPAGVNAVPAGAATFTFTDADNARFDYTVQLAGMPSAVKQTKQITRQVFGSPVPTCVWGAQAGPAAATNFQDIWWAAPAGSESGWGINFNHQGDTIFATWFTFGLDGKPLWLVVGASRTAAKVYAGTLYSGTGPAFNSVPFDSARVSATPAGTATLSFTDGNSASFDYSLQLPGMPSAVTQTKMVTRQVFAAPGTVCH